MSYLRKGVSRCSPLHSTHANNDAQLHSSVTRARATVVLAFCERRVLAFEARIIWILWSHIKMKQCQAKG